MKLKKVKSEPKDFVMTRVVTRDVFRDWFEGLRNLFGLRLRTYEKIIKTSTEEMLKEMRLRYHVVWYRVNVNPLTNGSAMIVIYGVHKE